MKVIEILSKLDEAKRHKNQVGMKKNGKKTVPKCVPQAMAKEEMGTQVMAPWGNSGAMYKQM
jgi:hypothetical protein